ncbi:hypothetical protein OPV22_018461 [Ensete ventricosum]|uniref:Uncharacterized protein n=1 Tax=Ensete ventricosum TaxID=4639 RepID=A0AAV8PJ06_ENSVE|nr:hypothetical protein OPV22_018461 [Ensete ventricosum]
MKKFTAAQVQQMWILTISHCTRNHVKITEGLKRQISSRFSSICPSKITNKEKDWVLEKQQQLWLRGISIEG